MAKQPRARVCKGNAARALKNLYHSAAAVYLNYTPLPRSAVVKAYIYYFLKRRVFNIIQNDKRTVNIFYADVIENHGHDLQVKNLLKKLRVRLIYYADTISDKVSSISFI